MTRIVGGFAGSLILQVPPAGTRPTTDRVREALFSALEARSLLREANVVDLYAGSGALGLEAASRGARHVALVEKHSVAARICRTNAQKVRNAHTVATGGSELTITIFQETTERFLQSTADEISVASHNITVAQTPQQLRGGTPSNSTTKTPYDVVFLDPPYELEDFELGHVLNLLVSVIDTETVVIVERSSRTPEPTWPHPMYSYRHQTYGETTLWWASLAHQ